MIPSTLAAASDVDWGIITGLVVIMVSAAIVAVVMPPMRPATIPACLIAGGIVGPRAPGLADAAPSHGLHRCRHEGRGVGGRTGIRPARRFGKLR